MRKVKLNLSRPSTPHDTENSVDGLASKTSKKISSFKVATKTKTISLNKHINKNLLNTIAKTLKDKASPLLTNFRGGKEGDNSYTITGLDIGTEYVKVVQCIVENEQLKVVGLGRSKQKLTDMQSGAVMDIASVVDNCDNALSMAEQMSNITIRDVVIGLAGELIQGKVTSTAYRRLQPEVPIELNELFDVSGDIEKKAMQKSKEALSWNTGQEDPEIELINAAVIDVYIDGYRVTNPIGFQGKDVTLDIYNAFAPLVHIGAIKTIANRLDLRLLTLTAEPFAVAKGISEDSEFSAIVIDIGGGTTDIAIINNGGIMGTKMFAIGGRSFTKKITQILDLDFARAEIAKLEHCSKSLKGKKMDILKRTMLDDALVWRGGVEIALSEFDNIDQLPNKILLCGGGSLLPEIREVLLADDNWYKEAGFGRRPTIGLLCPDDIYRLSSDETRLSGQEQVEIVAVDDMDIQDVTALGLVSVGYDFIGTDSHKDSVLDKLSKSLRI